MIVRIICLFCLLITSTIQSQKTIIPVNIEEFKENANIVVLNENLKLEIKSINNYQEEYFLECLVLNEHGFNQISLEENYDKSKKINNISVIICDLNGKVKNKFSTNDFEDISAYDGVSIYSDNRRKKLDFIPTQYPFVLKYQYQINSKNTAFLKSWMPFNQPYISILKSTYSILNETGEKLYFVEKNIDKFPVIKSKNTYEINNLKAFKDEYLMNYEKEIFVVNPFLEKINYEGFTFRCDNWKNFGIDYYNHFLKDNLSLTEETKAKVKDLIKPLDNKLDKIKKLYEYLQSTKRYVSVQIKEGGLCPMSVNEVEKYSYGDCKGLSNYLRALLNEAGIESFCAAIYGGPKKTIDVNDISFQGNHMILAIPFQKDLMFVECTDLESPLGYLGNFTSNRNAIVFKPNGAEIVETKQYNANVNLIYNNIEYKILEDLSILSKVKSKSLGINYGRAIKLLNLNNTDLKEYYTESYSHLNNLKLDKIIFKNNKEEESFIEEFDIYIDNYVTKDGENYIFAPNLLQRININIPKSRNRKFSFKINYGYSELDEIKIDLPGTHRIGVLPEKMILSTKFGEYLMEINLVDESLVCKRKLVLNEGNYLASDYEEYKKFIESISKLDNFKILIEKK